MKLEKKSYESGTVRASAKQSESKREAGSEPFEILSSVDGRIISQH